MSTTHPDTKLCKVKEIISKNVNEFLRKIYNLNDIGPFRENRRITPAFKMFEPSTSEYYEYKYFERRLESYIRENLVNSIITQLFELHDIDYSVPNYGRHQYVAFSNESIENVFPFEFIIETKNSTIGYRYTGPYWEDKQLKRILRKYGIDQVRVIEWEDENAISSEGIPFGISPKLRSFVFYVSAKEFFLSYFSSEEYELFVKGVKEAVAEANREIGFTTIPSLSLSYLSKFKGGKEEILSEICFSKLVFEEHGDCSIKNLLSVDDYKQLDEHFVKSGLYKSLIGSEQFAISFITSEYMYQILKTGGQFDYTAIVCGYIKSIEQLLYKMLKITLDYKGSSRLMIRPANSGDDSIKELRVKNPNNKKSWLIPFEREYEDFFDITLGSMIWFINDNESGWNISRNGKNTVRRYLFNYSKEDRNEHFHKDNIYDFDEVKRIRNNTIILMYCLIGGYRLSGDLKLDKRLLGVYDDNFDRMYKQMAQVPRARGFYLKFENQDEIRAILLPDQDRPVYDSQGGLKESIIRFVKVDRFKVDFEQLLNSITEENEIIVDYNHVPEKIWLHLGGGKRKPIEW